MNELLQKIENTINSEGYDIAAVDLLFKEVNERILELKKPEEQRWYNELLAKHSKKKDEEWKIK